MIRLDGRPGSWLAGGAGMRGLGVGIGSGTVVHKQKARGEVSNSRRLNGLTAQRRRPAPGIRAKSPRKVTVA